MIFSRKKRKNTLIDKMHSLTNRLQRHKISYSSRLFKQIDTGAAEIAGKVWEQEP